MIGPIFEKLSQEYPNAEFVKVDVDEQKEIAEACGVSGLPTFQFYQGGEKVFQMCGADPDGLKELLEWMELMEESKTKLVVVDFTASW
jgi:thioredoxin 1